MSKNFKVRFVVLLVTAALAVIPPVANSAPKHPPQAAKATQMSATDVSEARVNTLLGQSGYNFAQIPGKAVWTIDFTGKSLPKFTVILAAQDDLLVVWVTIAQKKNIPLSPDFMMKMLRFDHSLDRVKVGIDNDGDAFVRIDLSVRILDSQELKLNVEQVAAAANEVYGGIQSSLVM